MKILLVEDDQNKSSQIVRFLRHLLPAAEMIVASSYVGAIERILNRECDVILLDMTIPTYDVDVEDEGGRPRVFGGQDILRRMERRRVFIPVVVITQFDNFGAYRGESKTRDELDRELGMPTLPIIEAWCTIARRLRAGKKILLRNLRALLDEGSYR